MKPLQTWYRRHRFVGRIPGRRHLRCDRKRLAAERFQNCKCPTDAGDRRSQPVTPGSNSNSNYINSISQKPSYPQTWGLPNSWECSSEISDAYYTISHAYYTISDAYYTISHAYYTFILTSDLIYLFNPLTPTVAVICNFWHPDTLTLSHERQSVRMSKNTNDGLTRSGTGCFIAVPIWQQWASKGCCYV